MSDWTSVIQSKPIRSRLVLASDGIDIYFAVFNGDFWYNDGCAVYVTHWMELPEPPL